MPARDPYDSEQWWEVGLDHPGWTCGSLVLCAGGIAALIVFSIASATPVGPPLPRPPPSPPRPPPPPYTAPYTAPTATPTAATSPPPPPPPAATSSPPPPEVVPNTWRWVSDGSTTTNGDSATVVSLCGQEDLSVPQSVCVDPNSYAMAGVRCCGTTGSPGVQSSCCYPDSSAWNCGAPPCACPGSGADYERCMKVPTASEAEQRCAALGKRLCTVTEVEANAANGAGCYLLVRHDSNPRHHTHGVSTC